MGTTVWRSTSRVRSGASAEAHTHPHQDVGHEDGADDVACRGRRGGVVGDRGRIGGQRVQHRPHAEGHRDPDGAEHHRDRVTDETQHDSVHGREPERDQQRDREERRGPESGRALEHRDHGKGDHQRLDPMITRDRAEAPPDRGEEVQPFEQPDDGQRPHHEQQDLCRDEQAP